MAKDPAFLFYSNDFLSGTFTMTDEQVGKYIRLLCIQHQKGELTKKDMLNICKTYDEDVFLKFKEQDGIYYNVRLKEESEKRKAYSESRRKNKLSTKNEKTYVKHMENENENINDIINNNNNIADFPNLNNELFIKAFNEWLDFRKELRKPLKPSTIKKQLEFLNKQPDPVNCINQSIQNGWQGLFEVKNGYTGTFSKNGGNPNTNGLPPIVGKKYKTAILPPAN